MFWALWCKKRGAVKEREGPKNDFQQKTTQAHPRASNGPPQSSRMSARPPMLDETSKHPPKQFWTSRLCVCPVVGLCACLFCLSVRSSVHSFVSGVCSRGWWDSPWRVEYIRRASPVLTNIFSLCSGSTCFSLSETLFRIRGT